MRRFILPKVESQNRCYRRSRWCWCRRGRNQCCGRWRRVEHCGNDLWERALNIARLADALCQVRCSRRGGARVRGARGTASVFHALLVEPRLAKLARLCLIVKAWQAEAVERAGGVGEVVRA